MSKTLDKYLSELHRSRSQGSFLVSHHDMLTIKSETDARIAELTAEVERYRKALTCIANGKDINAWLADIARNALREGE